MAGFPNFHEADYGDGVVYGTVFLTDSEVEWRDVPRSEYGVFHIEDIPAMFRAANDYADRQGYAAAFPNFHQADHGNGVVYGTFLIKDGVTEWRDVPRDELGVYHIEDVGGMMRAANDYAARNGFSAGFPTFHQADHGNGVVCGIVLFKPGRSVWRDVPADLLSMYSRPPTPWAIVLCNLADVPPGANAAQRYIDYFTEAGSGTGGAFDYWRDVSYSTGGSGDMRGSQVFGWFDIGHTGAELSAFAGGAQRQQIFNWGLEAARRNNVDLSGFPHKIVILNANADHGAVGGGVVFAYADARPLEPTFFFHEMGHELGLDHSFGENTTPCASGDARPGAYCDVFDIMSAMNVRSFNDALNRRAGPLLNALSRERLGWLHRSRIWKPNAIDFNQTVALAAINRPDADGYLMLKLIGSGRVSGQTMPSTYTVEFRRAAGWDRGLTSDRVLVHEVRPDGLVRLLTNFSGGVLNVGSELVISGASIPAGTVSVTLPPAVVRLNSVDSTASTAHLRVWTLPQNGSRLVRIKYIHYDPPGSEVENEYLVIQNDTSSQVDLSNWTLRDAANHVYVFPRFSLESGAAVSIWTKAGNNDSSNLYWGRRQAVWNNLGDTAILRDAAGAEISRYTYR